MAQVATGPAAPTSAPKAIPPRERRTGLRQAFGVLGVLTETHASDKQLEVTVINVSLQGCAFCSPVPFRPGATYTMRIGTGTLHLASTLRIISSRDRSDGFYDVGAKFV